MTKKEYAENRNAYYVTKKAYYENRNNILESRERERTHKKNVATAKTVFNGVSILFAFFLLVMLIRNFTTPNFEFSSEYILDSLANINVFPVDLFANGMLDLSITADWGGLNPLRDFINIFADLLSFLQFISLMLFNALQYILQVLRIMFGF